MPKKRVIFTLIYADGAFMLSRNFRLQKVGDARWINRNYNFSTVATSIDELIILNVSRDGGDVAQFCADLQSVSQGCFVPLALGGGVRTMDDVTLMMAHGADKIVLNTPLFDDPDFVRAVVRRYGAQCVVASLDFRQKREGYQVYTENGTRLVDAALPDVLEMVRDLGVGELYLNSIDADGTGQGYRMDVLTQSTVLRSLPVIMAGGAGNHMHLETGLAHDMVDAVATANLFNFMGDGLPGARRKLLDAGLDIAVWR